MAKPRKEHTSERDLIRYCFYGLATSIGAYLRARREQFQLGWKDLEELTGVEGILAIERGKRFPTKKTELKKIYDQLKIQNDERLSDLIIALENFRTIVEKKRFKL